MSTYPGLLLAVGWSHHRATRERYRQSIIPRREDDGYASGKVPAIVKNLRASAC